MNCENIRPLLTAHFDGEIGAAQREQVAAHVQTCAACAADLEEFERVRRAVRSAMLYGQAPAALRERVTFALRGAEYLDRDVRRRNWRAWSAVAAGLAILALVPALYFVNVRYQRDVVAEDLLSAHQRALMGRMLDVISTDQHTVKPWFNGKLPFAPPVNDLAENGFPLQGGRVDYAGGHPVAAVVYGRRLHRIDVFIWPSAGHKAPPSHFARNGYNEVAWRKGDFEFVAVSDLNSAELTTFASVLRNK